ncbi:MAG: hypothetical protein O2971_03685 [Proteobacteria bacterium]|nr:hypothetical protein [Pseudomonadota bacterium]
MFYLIDLKCIYIGPQKETEKQDCAKSFALAGIWCQLRITVIFGCAPLRLGKMPQWFDGKGFANLLTNGS